jgi:AcrR family transcriptional regulator
MRSTVNLEQRELLLNQAQKLFTTHGIKNLTMDMIAKSLKMSKKTIYVMVRDKSQLVNEVIERYIQSEHQSLDSINQQAENPLHELVLIINRALEQTEDFNPESLFDMQKHYPESFQMFSQHRTTFLHSCLLRNLDKGAQDGFYRNDFNKDVIAKIYIGMLKVLVDQSLFPVAQYSFVEILKAYIDYHLRAIVTEKGLAELNKQKELNLIKI